MIRRLAGVFLRPRGVMTELVARPSWLGPWGLVLAVPVLCGALLLSTDLGRQALVDEQVRLTDAFGGTVDDAAYARLQAAPPYWVYLASGGRVLLNPVTTLAVAAGLLGLARMQGSGAGFDAALAVSVHATAVLALGQLVALPLDIVRESLSTPTTLAAVLPVGDDGTVTAAFFGALDVFGLWWMVVLAFGLSAMTGRGVGASVGRLAAVYAVVSGVLAAAMAALGGS
ncbi:MAG: YIP1 family protein [Vicinamibacterales bacterium]